MANVIAQLNQTEERLKNVARLADEVRNKFSGMTTVTFNSVNENGAGEFQKIVDNIDSVKQSLEALKNINFNGTLNRSIESLTQQIHSLDDELGDLVADYNDLDEIDNLAMERLNNQARLMQSNISDRLNGEENRQSEQLVRDQER
mgnify:FL=1